MFLICILFIILFNSVVEAAKVIPDKINIINQYQLDSRKYFGGTYVRDSSYKATSDGKVVYCAEYDKDPPMLNHSFSYTNMGETNAQIAYILMNGYPTRSMTGNQDKDYYITAMSLWYFFKPDADIWPKFDLDNGTYDGTYYDVADWIGKLVRGAQNYSYGESSITLTLSDADDPNIVDTYVSFKGTASMSGVTGNYSVSASDAPEGTYISDMTGSSKSKFANGESFLVNVPVDNIESVYNGIDVSVKAGSDVGKGYLFSVTNDIDYPNYQDVVTLYSDYVEVEDSDTYTMDRPVIPEPEPEPEPEPTTDTLKISKQDITTGKELPGAKLTLKAYDGRIIDEWVSTSSPHVIENLEAGKYYLIEETSPDGYIRSTEMIEFELKGNGSVVQQIMTNAPTEVTISKVDITNDKELAGAKLTIKDKDGNTVKSWTSTDEPYVIKALKPGKYTLTEEVAPEGYEPIKTEIEFTIGEDGKVTVGNKVVKDNLIVVENSPIPEEVPIVVKISKVDITNNKELPGAKLIIKDEKGNTVKGWTSTDKPYVIHTLKPGKYTLIEEVAPEGYELLETKVEFTISEDGKVTVGKTIVKDNLIVVENSPEPKQVPTGSTIIYITIISGIIALGVTTFLIMRSKKNK